MRPLPPHRWARLARRAAAVVVVGVVAAVLPVPALSFERRAAASTEDLGGVRPATAEELAAVDAVLDEPDTTDRVTATAPAAEPFTAIGVLFDEAPTAPVLIRTAGPDGALGDWYELEFEGDMAPDPGTEEDLGDVPVAGTNPFFVGEGTAYEVSLAAADAEHAEVGLVREELTRTVADATPLAGANTAPFEVRSRASWGARPATAVSYASSVRMAVVHHSATPNGYAAADVPARLRSIQAFHMDTRGWSDIAYNFVVDRFGAIWEGRQGGIDRTVIGAHAMGFNTGTTGVMILGDYINGVLPSAASIESASRVIGWKGAIHGFDPNGRLNFTSGGSSSIPAGQVVNLSGTVGHQEVGSTTCPGTIQAQMGSIRVRSQDFANWYRATLAPLGNIDLVQAGPGGLTALGWATDLDSDEPLDVHVYVDGVTWATVANLPRPDVQASVPAAGPSSGWRVDANPLQPGWRDVCVTAFNKGPGRDRWLGCTGVAVPEPSGQSPRGDMDALTFPGGVDVFGWTVEADGSPAGTIIEVDGGVRRVLPAGPFRVRIVGVAGGTRRVCAVGANRGAGTDFRYECRTVQVPAADPRGGVDQLRVAGRTIVASGWGVDDESLDPLEVGLVVDGRWTSVIGDRPRRGWELLYPDHGDARGFEVSTAAAPGARRACVVLVNRGGGTSNVLTCRDLVVK